MSYSFRQYFSYLPGKHNMQILQQTAISGTANTIQKVLIQKCKHLSAYINVSMIQVLIKFHLNSSRFSLVTAIRVFPTAAGLPHFHFIFYIKIILIIFRCAIPLCLYIHKKHGQFMSHNTASFCTLFIYYYLCIIYYINKICVLFKELLLLPWIVRRL